MAVYYLDTSALVKRYAQERGTAWMLSLTHVAAEHDLYTVRVTGPEMIAALFRKARTGEVSPDEARRSAENFRADWQQQYQIVEVTTLVADGAMELAQEYGLRGYDAVHLACSLLWQEILDYPVTLVTYDSQLWQAANSAGLRALPESLT